MSIFKKTVPIFVFLFLSFSTLFTPIPVYGSYGETAATIVSDYDGHINDANVNSTTGNDVYAGNNSANVFRGWFNFQLDNIPDNVVIVNVSLLYHGHTNVANCSLTEMTVNASTVTGTTLYNYAGNGTVIYNTTGFPVAGSDQTAELGVNRDSYCKSLETILASGQDWYSIGFKKIDESVGDGAVSSIYSEDYGSADPKPSLYIEYYESVATYVFTDTYYENGTLYTPAVEVTATGEGYIYTFNTSGGITQYYDPEPTLFNWDIGGGYSRPIYSVGSENITVTIPDDSFAVYSFDIRDYTLSVDVEGGYLEAYRTINGTETLIERAAIRDTIDAVSLNLVTNRVYRIRIRLTDDTVYDFGYFTPGVDTERTLVIDELEYDDYAHVYSKYITVEATRPNATYIQVNYEDTKSHTTSILVEIQYRNGTQIYNTTVAAATAQVNWYDAVNTTDYRVLVNATHPSYANGVIYRRTLNGEIDTSDAPDFSPIGISTELLCTGIVFLVGLTVSGEKPEIGIFAATSIAAAFVYYDVLPLTWTDIIVLYVISVGMGLGGRVR